MHKLQGAQLLQATSSPVLIVDDCEVARSPEARGASGRSSIATPTVVHQAFSPSATPHRATSGAPSSQYLTTPQGSSSCGGAPAHSSPNARGLFAAAACASSAERSTPTSAQHGLRSATLDHSQAGNVAATTSGDCALEMQPALPAQRLSDELSGRSCEQSGALHHSARSARADQQPMVVPPSGGVVDKRRSASDHVVGMPCARSLAHQWDTPAHLRILGGSSGRAASASGAARSKTDRLLAALRSAGPAAGTARAAGKRERPPLVPAVAAPASASTVIKRSSDSTTSPGGAACTNGALSHSAALDHGARDLPSGPRRAAPDLWDRCKSSPSVALAVADSDAAPACVPQGACNAAVASVVAGSPLQHAGQMARPQADYAHGHVCMSRLIEDQEPAASDDKWRSFSGVIPETQSDPRSCAAPEEHVGAPAHRDKHQAVRKQSGSQRSSEAQSPLEPEGIAHDGAPRSGGNRCAAHTASGHVAARIGAALPGACAVAAAPVPRGRRRVALQECTSSDESNGPASDTGASYADGRHGAAAAKAQVLSAGPTTETAAQAAAPGANARCERAPAVQRSRAASELIIEQFAQRANGVECTPAAPKAGPAPAAAEPLRELPRCVVTAATQEAGEAIEELEEVRSCCRETVPKRDAAVITTSKAQCRDV